MKDIAVRWGLGGGGTQPILAAAIAALTSTVEIFVITRCFQGEKFVLPPLAGGALVCLVGDIHRRLVPVHVRRL